MEAGRPHSPSHTSLMLACQQESKGDVQAILNRQPAAVLQRDRSGKSALHYCAENGGAECAGRLLSAAPLLLDARDEEGYSPLHLAVISGNRTMVKYLLAKGADVAAADSELHTCVHWATVCGEPECLELLMTAGADPSTPDMHGAYPVHYAAQMCGPNSEAGTDIRQGLAVLRILLARGVDVTMTDRDGRQPLLWAASAETRASKTYCPSGSSDAILALVNAGADVNAEDKDGLTALHCAASRGHLDCLETLVTLCGAELEKLDGNGCSALFYAVTLGHADCTNLLLGFGADPNRQDRKGRTPAHCGASKGQMETLKILSQHNANLWLRNARGDMPLHEAVQSGRKDLVEWLLNRHQGSVNVSNSNGRTPLHIAAITNNVDMCKVLMDYGAFINPIMRNSKGQQLTPLDAALHRSHRGCARYLNLHGALPASKLLDKKDCNRVTETLELSPNARLKEVRDSSAQTEVNVRDADAQVHVMTRGSPAQRSRIPPPTEMSCVQQSSNIPSKPIIAKVYVHTKRTRTKRVVRKPTAYKKDFPGEKISVVTRRQQQNSIAGHYVSNGDSTVQTALTPPMERAEEVPQRKTSIFQEDRLNLPQRKTSIFQEDRLDLPQRKTSIFQEDRLDLPLIEQLVQPTPEEEEHHMTTDEDGGGGDSKIDLEETDFRIAQSVDESDDHEPPSQERPLSARESHVEELSPLPSIRSLESTVKDSGFSDDRGPQEEATSEDEEEGRRHIARYIVSSGAADKFRLDEEDEDGTSAGTATPRSFSMPHIGEKEEEEEEETARVLHRPNLSKDILRSLKKYQMERRLFYELQELKRKQICGIREDEQDIVRKIVKRFREHVLSPTMDDFRGPFTFRSFERYLYEQLRKLSMGGKIPKLKMESKSLPSRSYQSPMGLRERKMTHVLCACDSRKCHHVITKKDPFPSSDRLPQIVRTVPTAGSRVRSKSWDRLEDQTPHPKEGSLSLPTLSHPFPRKIPASLLAAICERLGPQVHPDDTVVVEMTREGVAARMRHAFAVREIRDAVARYEKEAGHRVRPVLLESVLDEEDQDSPVTFEIRHGRERNVFRLPAHKLRDNRKWQVTFTIGKGQKELIPHV